MYHKIYEEDGNTVQEFDLEAIEYFIDGLEALKTADPGDILSAPSFHERDGILISSFFILMRAEDPE